MQQPNGGLALATSRANGLGPRRGRLFLIKTVQRCGLEEREAPEGSSDPSHPQLRSIPHTRPGMASGLLSLNGMNC